MVDGIFRLTFPLSYPILMLGVVVSFFILIIFIGTLSSLTFLILIQCGILRLKPITDLLHSICIAIWPDLPERIIENLKKSFPVEIMGTLPDKGIYLFHPHGVLTLAHMINIGLPSISNWPVKNIQGTALYSFWYSFGIREILDGTFIPSKYDDMKNVIDKNMSLSVSLGGIEEMKYVRKHHIKLKLKDRKGIFRLAIETGTPLVPVLAYGENEACDNLGTWKGFDWINESLYRTVHCNLIMPSWAIFEKYFSISHKPFDTPIVSVIGEPVAVGPARTPTEEDIRVLRNIYIKRLRELYKNTKPPQYSEELEII